MGNLLKLFNAIHEVAVNIRCEIRPLQLIKNETGTLAAAQILLSIAISDGDELYSKMAIANRKGKLPALLYIDISREDEN